jgi:hypothetical protein
MKNKYQLLVTAVISAVVVIVMATLAVGLVGSYFYVSAADAQQESTSTPAMVPLVQAESGASRTITVVGEGKISAKPDVAQANIGVEVIDNDVQQASNKASEIMETLLTTLQDQGTAESDIQTSYYNVWVERPYGQQGGPSGETIYHVNNNVMVKIRELDKVADILGSAIEAGANNINSVNFSLSDPSSLRSEARQKAVDNALAKAEELAALNGVEIGQVVNVSEVISGGAYYVSELAAAGQGGFGGGGGGPISPGEVELTVQLQVSYAIQ